MFKLSKDFVGWQQADARRQDGRFEHGILRAIEPKEVALPALCDNVRFDSRPRLCIVDRPGLKSVPAAGVGQDPTLDVRRIGSEAGAGPAAPTAARASNSTSSVT